MDTYTIIDGKKMFSFAFEIENIYIGIGTVVEILNSVEKVSNVVARKRFTKFNDVHIEFKYSNHDYIVWEPYGDNSRYWIGPIDTETIVNDIEVIENAFKDYSLPWYREIIGNIVSLSFFMKKK